MFRTASALRELIDACARACAVEASLAISGLQGTIERIERASPASSGEHMDYEVLERHRVAVDRAYRLLPFESTCLRRSLLRFWLGRRQRLGVELVVGVRRDVDFSAHAWIDMGRGQEAVDGFVVILRAPRNATVLSPSE